MVSYKYVLKMKWSPILNFISFVYQTFVVRGRREEREIVLQETDILFIDLLKVS
jgi:hypothetical protein